MPYEALAIANTFLKIAGGLDNMKVQKLVYYAHGWHLALKGTPLIDESVQAWPWGPVVPSVFHEFKSYGNQRIRGLAMDFSGYVDEYGEGSEYAIISDGPDSAYALALVEKVWEVFGDYSGVQLSKMTHEEGTPWDTVNKQFKGRIPRQTIIPDSLIRDFFVSQSSETLPVRTEYALS